MNAFFLLFLAVIPSTVWLALYLRQDAHPEPKGLVIKVFLAGMVSALGAAITEGIFLCSFTAAHQCGSEGIFSSPLIALDRSPLLALIVGGFVGIALIEETSKYLAVRWSIVKHRSFDEPVDAMIYLIIAALGFATVENVLIIFQRDVAAFAVSDVIRLSLFRFLGATFLHTTAAGITGYFLSRAFFPGAPKRALILAGLLLAAFTHWLYNSFIDRLAAGAAEGVLDARALFGLFLLLSISGIIIFSLLKYLRLLSFRYKFHALGET